MASPTRVNRIVGGLAGLAVASVAEWLIVPTVQGFTGDQFDDARLGALRTVFVTIGGALIGATAVTLSIVMVAVQLNFVRLPHALFRKVSSDKRILLEFAFTFLCGVVIALLSLLPDKEVVGGALVLASILLALTLIAFLDAYSRALVLVSPAHQLGAVVTAVRRDLGRWNSRARRLRPLFETREDRVEKDHDWNRFRFFLGNPGWDREARQGVLHAISFASRYAREREHDVGSAAFGAIITINALYIQVRGKTFFGSDPFFNTGLGEEPFITFVLEELRKFSSPAIASGDEELLRQLMRTLASLAEVYAQIDYGKKLSVSLQHTQLAGAHLTGLVELALPKATPDLLMEGVRQMGRCAKTLARNSQSAQAVTIAEKLANFSAVGIARPAFGPVTMEVVRELSDLTLIMIAGEEFDPDFALGRVSTAIASIALAALAVAESPLTREHEGLVAAYYSTAQHGTFGERFMDLVNKLGELKADSDDAKRVIHHISDWAEDLYDSHGKVLQAAIAKRSSLVFSAIHWPAHIVKCLMAVACHPAAEGHWHDKLVKACTFLLGRFTFILGDAESMHIADSYSLVEALFDVGVHAKRDELFEVEDFVGDVLISWGLKGATFEAGWTIIKGGVTAVVVLALLHAEKPAAEVSIIADRLGKRVKKLPPEAKAEVLKRAADALRELADDLPDRQFPYSQVEFAMRNIDGAILSDALRAAADELDSPVATVPV
jgi:hypothetical protein